MSIKILGGVARGFPLTTPKTLLTRPTAVLVRRKLFDWRQNLEGLVFIDLLAGSGAMGFEALSRGAQKVFLNDTYKISVKCLKENSERLQRSFNIEQGSISITELDALRWLKSELSYQLSNSEDVILFVDPPYEDHKLYTEILKTLKEINFKGEVWVESDRLKGPKKETLTGAFHSIIKTIDQGDHFVVIGFLV